VCERSPETYSAVRKDEFRRPDEDFLRPEMYSVVRKDNKIHSVVREYIPSSGNILPRKYTLPEFFVTRRAAAEGRGAARYL
jgi:hypothetical protein